MLFDWVIVLMPGDFLFFSLFHYPLETKDFTLKVYKITIYALQLQLNWIELNRTLSAVRSDLGQLRTEQPQSDARQDDGDGQQAK